MGERIKKKLRKRAGFKTYKGYKYFIYCVEDAMKEAGKEAMHALFFDNFIPEGLV